MNSSELVKYLLFLVATAFAQVKNDCYVDSRAFTGVRVRREWQVSWNIHDRQTSLTILNCDMGRTVNNITLETDLGGLFNTTLCSQVSPYWCVRMVRRQIYVDWFSTHFIPGHLVGAVYELSLDESLKAKKISPLVSERFTDQALRLAHANQLAPSVIYEEYLVRSPDLLDSAFPRDNAWQDQFDLFEYSSKH